MSELLKQAGKDLIQGLINGIGSMGSALKNKAGDLAGGAIDSIKGTLGIASPSRVMMQVGKWDKWRGVHQRHPDLHAAQRRRRDGRSRQRARRAPYPALGRGWSSRRAGGQAPQEVHLHIEGAFVGDRIGLARELEAILNDRRTLVGEA